MRGKQEGMLAWLEAENFPVAAQAAAALMLSPEPALEANRMRVENHGANRKYPYLPYSAEAESIAGPVRRWLDAGYRASALRGVQHVEFEEWSSDQPGELLHAPEWIKAPQTETQIRYAQAEAVYRSFVDQCYLDVDPETELLIRKLFLKEPMTSPGIYEAVTRIRMFWKNTFTILRRRLKRRLLRIRFVGFKREPHGQRGAVCLRGGHGFPRHGDSRPLRGRIPADKGTDRPGWNR